MIKWSKNAARTRDLKALRQITQAEADKKFAAHIQAVIPSLFERGWLRRVGHSDGDYVLVTDDGRAALGWEAKQ